MGPRVGIRVGAVLGGARLRPPPLPETSHMDRHVTALAGRLREAEGGTGPGSLHEQVEFLDVPCPSRPPSPSSESAVVKERGLGIRAKGVRGPGPQGRAWAAGDVRTAEVQSQEARTEGRTRFPDCPALLRSRCPEQPSLTVPVPPLSHSSYECLGVRVAVDEMDGGSPHKGSRQLTSSLCLSCKGKPLLYRSLPSAAAGEAPAFVVDHAGTRGNLQDREGSGLCCKRKKFTEIPKVTHAPVPDPPPPTPPAPPPRLLNKHFISYVHSAASR